MENRATIHMVDFTPRGRPYTIRDDWLEFSWIHKLNIGCLVTSYPIPGTQITGLEQLNVILNKNEQDYYVHATLTCQDLNYVTIDCHLERLIAKKIRNILVVTGEEYKMPRYFASLYFEDSFEIIRYLTKKYPTSFSIGIVAFGGVDMVLLFAR